MVPRHRHGWQLLNHILRSRIPVFPMSIILPDLDQITDIHEKSGIRVRLISIPDCLSPGPILRIRSLATLRIAKHQKFYLFRRLCLGRELLRFIPVPLTAQTIKISFPGLQASCSYRMEQYRIRIGLEILRYRINVRCLFPAAFLILRSPHDLQTARRRIIDRSCPGKTLCRTRIKRPGQSPVHWLPGKCIRRKDFGKIDWHTHDCQRRTASLQKGAPAHHRIFLRKEIKYAFCSVHMNPSKFHKPFFFYCKLLLPILCYRFVNFG